MEVGTAVEDMVFPDGEGPDGVSVAQLRSGLVLLKVGRLLHIGPAIDAGGQQVEGCGDPASRLQISVQVEPGGLPPRGRLVRE